MTINSIYNRNMIGIIFGFIYEGLYYPLTNIKYRYENYFYRLCHFFLTFM